MSRLFIKYISIISSIYLLSFLLKTIHIEHPFALFIMGLVLFVINLLLKPILLVITLPFNIITFGLFSFIINAWTIMIADFFVPGISMGGFFNSLLTAIIIVILQHLLRDEKHESNH